MVRFFISIAMVLSMFSIIPVPRFEWKKENMAFMLANLPFAGLPVFAAAVIWFYAAGALKIGPVAFAVVLTFLPLIISGGIHMDGYLDTHDALASFAETAKKREILKDPHIGTFAAVWGITYVALFFCAVMETEWDIGKIIIFGCMQLSARAVGAFLSLNVYSYGSGYSGLFSSAADKRTSNIILLIYFMASCGAAAVADPCAAVIMAAVSAFCALGVNRMANKQFGGMSGDIAGYAIQLSALLMMIIYALFGKVVALL